MAYQIRRGLGATAAQYCSQGRWNWLTSADCWAKPLAQWQTEFASTYTAVPPAPVNLTLPPAGGADASASVQDLVNQQMAAQQAADASGVDSTVFDQAAGVVVNAGDSLNPANWIPSITLPSIPWGLVAVVSVVGVLALAAVGAGQPRRYGR